MKNHIDLDFIRKYENIDLLSKQLVEGFITGLHRSPYHGFSVEFSEHQPYNQGESVKNIDWKLFARTDKLFTKRFEEETNLRAHILIDTSSSMYYPEPNHDKITFSIMATACLMQMLHKQKEAVGLYTFNDQLTPLSKVKSSGSHIRQLMTQLVELYKPIKNVKTHLPSVLHDIAQKAHKRSLIVLFSDFQIEHKDLPDLFSAFQNIKHNNHELIIFHVQDEKTEKKFDFDALDHRFVDLETGKSIQLNTLQIKEHYQQAFDSFVKEIEVKAGQYKLDYNLVNTSTPFSEILYAFIAKRKRL